MDAVPGKNLTFLCTIFSMGTTCDLSGTTALITGAGKRIGRAFAIAIAERGGDVVIHYRGSQQAAEETADRIRSLGRRADVIQADLSDASHVASLISRAASTAGEINLLINNASIFENVDFPETTIETWERHIAINLTAPFLLSQSFAAARAGKQGAILNMLDWRALRPGPDHFAYTISKAGLAAMTKSLAQALAPGIRVNGLALGAILPPPGADGRDEQFVKDVPAGRWGSIEETVQAMLFLVAGPEFITGEILHLDGGRHLV